VSFVQLYRTDLQRLSERIQESSPQNFNQEIKPAVCQVSEENRTQCLGDRSETLLDKKTPLEDAFRTNYAPDC
jgi:hypothetical protein